MDMPMRSTVPDWLTPVAWTYISVSLLSAVFIAADIYLLQRRRGGVVTGLVWITSALYLGPFAVPLYLRRGRANPSTAPVRGTVRSDEMAVGVLPGGGASAVAHLIGVPLVAAAGWTIAGMAMWPMIIVIAVLAIVMLAAYERVTIHGAHTRRTHGFSVGAAIVTAVITVAAFDIGMVGWMLFLNSRDAMPPVTDGTFWFLMQVGVIVGLLTGYPAVKWLLRRHPSVVPA
jgi:hypothetical protein